MRLITETKTETKNIAIQFTSRPIQTSVRKLLKSVRRVPNVYSVRRKMFQGCVNMR